MRALAERIRRFSDECQRVEGRVIPGPTVEFEHLDPVINALDDALVVIRTLDREVFEPSSSSYVSFRDSDPQGRVVHAMTAPRDSAVHQVDVVDPDLARGRSHRGESASLSSRSGKRQASCLRRCSSACSVRELAKSTRNGWQSMMPSSRADWYLTRSSTPLPSSSDATRRSQTATVMANLSASRCRRSRLVGPTSDLPRTGRIMSRPTSNSERGSLASSQPARIEKSQVP